MVQVVLVGARWLHFLSMAVLLGSSLFALLVPRSSTGGVGEPMQPVPREGSSVAFPTMTLLMATVVAVLSGLAWLAASLATMNDGFAGVADAVFLQTFFFETPFGPVELVRLAMLAGLLAMLTMAARRTRLGATAALAAGLLVSQAWLGHAAEGGDTVEGWSMVASYAAHVLAVGAWIGSLPSLLLILRRPVVQAVAIVTLLRRYSTLATVAALVVVGSGVTNAAFRLGGNLSQSVDTDYGHLLLFKLLLVAIVLCLAAVSRFVLLPRLRRDLIGNALPLTSLRTVIGLEFGVATAVLAVTALLGVTPPPH